MSHQIMWTKFIVETFVEKGNLTKDEEMILRTRAAGYTITQQAEKFKMSTSTVSRIIRRLKRKYDFVQLYSPELPPRKKSAKELYQDKH